MYILIGIALWNLTVLFLYAMDKYRAKRGSWRVSEKTLLLCALFGGGIGGVAGMYLLRHKTRHMKFRVLIPVALVITLIVAALIQWPGLLTEIRTLFSGAHLSLSPAAPSPTDPAP
jgi:uncharacterized membrane protein YsdA (DUF1294 family)